MKPDIVLHTYNPSTKEAKAGGLQFQGQHGVYSELQDSLGLNSE